MRSLRKGSIGEAWECREDAKANETRNALLMHLCESPFESDSALAFSCWVSEGVDLAEGECSRKRDTNNGAQLSKLHVPVRAQPQHYPDVDLDTFVSKVQGFPHEARS